MVIDQDAKTIEVLDNRELAMHLNVRKILQSAWWCPAHNCLNIQFLDIDLVNNIYKIKGTLVNPTNYSGFDVRAIIFLDEKGHQLLNPDDYSMLYEDGTDINPFRAYAKTMPQRRFTSYASFSEIFEMYIPPVPKKFMIDFAIDASWPSNCPEPYDLDAFGYEGKIYPDDPDLEGTDQGEGLVYTKVLDWQSNVSEVTVDTTPITGDITSLAYNVSTDRWEAAITDTMDAPPGDYVCLIGAFSTDDSTIGLYNYLTVTVQETPPPAVQTIYGHVGDGFVLSDLDGTVLSVVNEDPLGFQPPPVTVVDGQYSVDVTTGVFNMSVVPPDMVHLSQVCTDVIVTTNEDIHIDFGLNDPTETDPAGIYFGTINWPITQGFAGRVVDSVGNPISSASVELTTLDVPGQLGQEFLQAEVTDSGGYFSMMNCPIAAALDPWVYNVTMHVCADGYQGAIIGPIGTMANAVPYQVITLSPAAEVPVWKEDFETDTGWAMDGYYHRQKWDPPIFNVSFSPSNSFLWWPADEAYGGNIPPGTNGEYYLWYGVPADGNFIGEWSSESPYNGGQSLNAHAGTATSPAINLTANTTARVEFDLCYDIESQIPDGYDEMRFYVNGNQMKFFNPVYSPGPVHFTFTQRGYNRTPIWCHYVFDITPFAGGTVNLAFSFSTDDNLYNGARGEFIDNIKVFAQ